MNLGEDFFSEFREFREFFTMVLCNHGECKETYHGNSSHCPKCGGVNQAKSQQVVTLQPASPVVGRGQDRARRPGARLLSAVQYGGGPGDLAGDESSGEESDHPGEEDSNLEQDDVYRATINNLFTSWGLNNNA